MEKNKITNTLLVVLIFISVANFAVGHFWGKQSHILINDTSYAKLQADSLRKEIKELKATIVFQEHKISENDSLLKLNKEKKTNIKNKANEKISATKSFNATMWEHFFTTRYHK